jgi:hypothetical protein
MSTFPIQCTNKECNKVWDAARFATDLRDIKRCPTCGASVKRIPKKPQSNRASSSSSSSSVYSGSKLVVEYLKIKSKLNIRRLKKKILTCANNKLSK